MKQTRVFTNTTVRDVDQRATDKCFLAMCVGATLWAARNLVGIADLTAEQTELNTIVQAAIHFRTHSRPTCKNIYNSKNPVDPKPTTEPISVRFFGFRPSQTEKTKRKRSQTHL